ncbi:MAG: hypothetical protein ACFE9R_19365 [Candidatus Hermodarchaeota archaeon]
MENQLFNLEKIKDLTSIIDILQAKIHHLSEISMEIKNYREYARDNFTEKKFISQIEDIAELVSLTTLSLENVGKHNINIFLNLQEQLFQKYKTKFKEKLIKLNLNQDLLRKIGLELIENKQISKTLHKISYTPSIEDIQWLEILEALNENSIFLRIIKNAKIYFKKFTRRKLEMELSKIPKDTGETLITEFEKVFLENPYITFKEFLDHIEEESTQKDLIARKDKVLRAKEEEELERLKKKQEEQKETYEDYLKLSDSEFERKIRKKSREKLKIVSKAKERKEIEFSDEVSEKIEKFKSKFDKSFEEKYLIQKDDEQDPIDLIRERRRKKKKEYKKYKDHFDDSD